MPPRIRRNSAEKGRGAVIQVIESSDDDVSWTDRSTGLDGYLGAVRFLSDTTVIVLGERGTALRRELGRYDRISQ